MFGIVIDVLIRFFIVRLIRDDNDVLYIEVSCVMLELLEILVISLQLDIVIFEENIKGECIVNGCFGFFFFKYYLLCQFKEYVNLLLMFFWLFCIMIEEKEFIMDILGVSGMDVENVLVLFINICVNWFVVFRMKVI